MLSDQLKKLRPKLHGTKNRESDVSLGQVEKLLNLPSQYRELLITFGGAIVFMECVRFKADEPNPIAGSNGFLGLDRLYGLGNGADSIISKAIQYDGELPPSLVPIGELPGGDLVCASEDGRVFLWDHESDRSANAWKVADSLDQFLCKLEVDDSPIGNTDSVIDFQLDL